HHADLGVGPLEYRGRNPVEEHRILARLPLAKPPGGNHDGAAHGPLGRLLSDGGHDREGHWGGAAVLHGGAAGPVRQRVHGGDSYHQRSCCRIRRQLHFNPGVTPLHHFSRDAVELYLAHSERHQRIFHAHTRTEVAPDYLHRRTRGSFLRRDFFDGRRFDGESPRGL